MARISVVLCLVIAAAIVVLAFRCGPSAGRTSPRDASAAPTAPSLPPADATRQAGVIARFGLRSFHSFADAERAAGFHIPRPSSEFRVAYGMTSLRAPGRDGIPLSTTGYLVPGLPPTDYGEIAITVDVGTGDYWFRGVTSDGRPATIGGRQVWVLDHDAAGINFAFQCGQTNGAVLWCGVTAPAEVPAKLLDQFVASIR